MVRRTSRSSSWSACAPSRSSSPSVPADANETAEAWRVALSLDGPCVLVFSRQDLPVLDRSGAWGAVANGAYIISGAEGDPDVVLIGTGSEVELAVRAAALLA